MKALIILNLALNLACLAWLGYWSVTREERMREAAVAVIIDDARILQEQVEAEIVEQHRDEINAIYEDLGVDYNPDPSSPEEMMQPLVEVLQAQQRMESEQSASAEAESDEGAP